MNRNSLRFQAPASGFALPTILIASVVMMIVLVGAVSTVSSVRASLTEQYYTGLAKEAAESGLERAKSCLQANNNIAPWIVAGKSLTPSTDCSGDPLTGASAYVLDTPSVRTRFTVSGSSQDGGYRVLGSGSVELIRATGGSVWKSYSSAIAGQSSTQALEATDTASGIFQTCGIFDAKTWCWGRNDKGQLGIGLTDAVRRTEPVQVVREAGMLLEEQDKYVAVGNEVMCIATVSNNVYCVGANYAGQLGNNATADRNKPVRVDVSGTGMAGKTINGLVAGMDFVCALANQDVYCWGNGEVGQMGSGSTVTRLLKPNLVTVVGAANGRPVSMIAATPQARHACAIASNRAYCWGLNDRGQIGNGTTSWALSPVAVTTPSGMAGKNIISIATTGGFAINGSGSDGTTPNGTRRAHTCAVTSDGQVYCWGSNQYGQMGQGSWSMAVQSTPVRVMGALSTRTVTQVGTSYGTTCALTTGNQVYCWGQNTNGQVGDGTSGASTHRYNPTLIIMTNALSGKTVTSVIGGVNRQCVIASAVSYCWGLNTEGQLGDGTNISRSEPTEAKLLRQFRPALRY